MFLPSNITLRPGDNGDFVTELQRRLAARDLLSESEITASYDGSTTNAVIAFQSMNGLRTDGIAGPDTLRRLNNLGGQSESGGGTSEAEEEEYIVGASRQSELVYANQLADGLQAGELHGMSPLVDNAEAIIEHEHGTKEKSTENEQAPQQQQQREIQRQFQRDAQNIEMQGDQQRHEQRDNVQIEFTRDHIRAQSPLESLDKPIVTQYREAGSEAEIESSRRPQQEIVHHRETKPALPAQEAERSSSREPQLTTATPPRDPELARTEARLAPSSRDESQATGRALDSQGVQNNGSVAIAQLGSLSPSQTPSVGQQQQVGIG